MTTPAPPPPATAPTTEPDVLGSRDHETVVVRDPSTAEAVAKHLDKPMSALGIVFLLVVLAQVLAEDPAFVAVLTVVGWVLWAVFVAEFGLRAWIAKDQGVFWRRNWWQLVFLAVPFLRFARALTLLRVTRVARAGSVLSAAVRGSRSGGRLLSGRVTWLGLVTGVVILAASQLLYVLGSYDEYAVALHEAAMTTVTGTALSADGVFARLLEVTLAIYSVVVFATLAGALGAYFLQRGDQESAA
ncbi:hypothetical protein [Aquipuribacter sp. MA13-6]|uniref:hypothetical protein n=1 Tax=unclassified Aquipuribacter TaxID=2635084 RepID=UPI003EEE3D13